MPQESNSIAGALRGWFRGCPLLQAGAKVGFDYLPDTATEYAIYETPSTIRYVENVLGEEVPADKQTQNFVFAAKLPYGADTAQNLANARFHEQIIAWIISQNAQRLLPAIPGGKVLSVTPTLTAFPIEVGSDVAKYQIQLKIIYRRY